MERVDSIDDLIMFEDSNRRLGVEAIKYEGFISALLGVFFYKSCNVEKIFRKGNETEII